MTGNQQLATPPVQFQYVEQPQSLVQPPSSVQPLNSTQQVSVIPTSSVQPLNSTGQSPMRTQLNCHNERSCFWWFPFILTSLTCSELFVWCERRTKCITLNCQFHSLIFLSQLFKELYYLLAVCVDMNSFCLISSLMCSTHDAVDFKIYSIYRLCKFYNVWHDVMWLISSSGYEDSTMFDITQSFSDLVIFLFRLWDFYI